MKIKFKFLLFCVMVAFASTSCDVIKETANVQRPTSYINTATLADLDVSPTKITFTLEPSREVQRGGERNVVQTAINEALKHNGGGDVLVNMTYTTKTHIGLFGSRKITSITVSGYPATYKNFRNVDDKIWTNTPLDGAYPDNQLPIKTVIF